MKRSLIIVTVIGLMLALSSLTFGQSTPVKKKGKTKVVKPTNGLGGDNDLIEVKGTAKKQTANLGGEDDVAKNQRSAKKPTNGITEFDSIFVKPDPKSTKKQPSKTSKTKTTGFVSDTPAEVKSKKSISKTTNLSGEDDFEKTQRSSKTNNSNAKTTGSPSVTPKKNAKKTTNFQTTSEDLLSVKKAKTQNGVNDPGDWSSEAKPKTTPKSSNTTSRKRKVNGIHEGNELKTPKKKP